MPARGLAVKGDSVARSSGAFPCRSELDERRNLKELWKGFEVGRAQAEWEFHSDTPLLKRQPWSR